MLIRQALADNAHKHPVGPRQIITTPRNAVRVAEIKLRQSFKAGINYWVGGSDHLSIRYGYEIGRDEDTLEKTDVTKLGLGLRF